MNQSPFPFSLHSVRFNVLSSMLVLCLSLTILSAHEVAPRASQLEAKGIASMEAREFEQAEVHFRSLIELVPSSFVGHYNLGASLSMQGRQEDSVVSLSKAIALGFSDLAQLKRDPDLDTFRRSDFFTQLVSEWGGLIEARRQQDRTNLLPLMKKLESRTNEELKLELLSAHDQIATDQAYDELGMLAEWSYANLFPQVQSPESLEDLSWIMVALPERRGFTQWAVTVFGQGVTRSISSVGGAYEHQKRRLVAQDLGATLRHEFIHVLHWRDMNRLGQAHAPWIQEGLASLVEDYDMKAGEPVPVPSWRTNIVKRMLDVGRLSKIELLAKTEMNAFTSKRPLAKYAQARAIMLFLLDQGKLTEFYNTYCDQYAQDPTGILSIETVLSVEIDEVNAQYRAWVSALETVPETGSDLRATLGIEIENANGDGVVVKGLPGGARTRTGLRLGSVITAINGAPTRDLFELIRILGQYSPGQTITLHHRRGTVHSTSEVELLSQ
jgi:tetratricopeptide (TPR) repeat protein